MAASRTTVMTPLFFVFFMNLGDMQASSTSAAQSDDLTLIQKQVHIHSGHDARSIDGTNKSASSNGGFSILQTIEEGSVKHKDIIQTIYRGGGFIFVAGLLGAVVATVITNLADKHETSGKQEDNPSITEQPTEPEPPSVAKVAFFVVGGSICASMLTISNKMAMSHFHPPSVSGVAHGHASYMWTLISIQFLCAAGVAWVAGALGLCPVTPLQVRKILAFFPAAGMFMITIAAGNAVMNFSNVNAFLVLRALVPLPCSLAETWIYREPLPPPLSGAALLVTVGGALAYGRVVGGIEFSSLAWAGMYLVMMPIDALLIKHSISSLDISPWGLVLYNNILAAGPAILMMLAFEIPDISSFAKMCEVAVTFEAGIAISVSCLIGIAISYFQLRTRYYVSATAFMVLGVVNKFATVLVNNAINEHQGLLACFCIVVTICGAILWQMTVKGNSIKVREGSHSWEKSPVIPFSLVCAGLAWAAYVEYSQVMA